MNDFPLRIHKVELSSCKFNESFVLLYESVFTDTEMQKPKIAFTEKESPATATQPTEIMREEIKKACEIMYKGGVILYPTDTVWGIGCDATNEEAVRRVYEIKRRADSKAMLVLVDNPVKVDFYVNDVPPVAWKLMELSTKPLTIIYDGARNLAPNLLAEDGSVGIRVTDEAFSKGLCFRFRKAVVSTSANISGQPSPAVFSEISEEIKNAVDYIVDYRREETGRPKPSGIIKVGKGGVIKIIRQ